MSTIKRTLAIFLCFVLVAAAVPVSASAAETAWDGKTIDVSWYTPDATTYYISTPAQLMGLAAIVNGIYNADITTIIGNAAYIVDNVGGEELTTGSSNLSTTSYHYGSDDFNGKTIYLTADLDMGGVYNAAKDTWSGPNYMPIGGQYLMTKNDSTTKLGSSFCGTLDGQGHMIYNIYCDRHCSSGNYGDGSSVGLIGRLGVHDSDPESSRPTAPAVRNLGITGYIRANRSVGGIVGKIGKTVNGATIENCANYATISNTDAKGCGGIVGAGWNGGVVRNCYNAGTVSSSYTCPTGGISGSNEITIENCYNIGTISASADSYAMAIGTNNGGGTNVTNCFWLTDSAPGGGYYGKTNGTVTECSAAELKSAATLSKLGSAFTADTTGLNGGYPILKWQVGTSLTSSVASSAQTASDVDLTAWYSSYYQYVTEQGLMDPVSTGTFAPDAPMTRAMLATALYRMAGSPWTVAVSQFTDVPADADYAKAVAWAYEKGIVNGMTDTTFAPDASITREQIAAMFYRYAKNVAKLDMTASGDLAAYGDSTKISSWALDSVRWAVGAGLINGTSTTTVTPQGTATRIQTAAMLTRLAAAAAKS
jgi:hypothetical protein